MEDSNIAPGVFECAVCFSPMEDPVTCIHEKDNMDHNFRHTTCHNFCQDCLEDIIQNEPENPKCPVCRMDIVGYGKNSLAVELYERFREQIEKGGEKNDGINPEQYVARIQQLEKQIEDVQNLFHNEATKSGQLKSDNKKMAQIVGNLTKDLKKKDQELDELEQEHNNAFQDHSERSKKQILELESSLDEVNSKLKDSKENEQQLEQKSNTLTEMMTVVKKKLVEEKENTEKLKNQVVGLEILLKTESENSANIYEQNQVLQERLQKDVPQLEKERDIFQQKFDNISKSYESLRSAMANNNVNTNQIISPKKNSDNYKWSGWIKSTLEDLVVPYVYGETNAEDEGPLVSHFYDYTIMSHLGSRKDSLVRKAERKDTKEIVALKEINNGKAQSQFREGMILKLLSHQCILPLRAFVKGEKESTFMDLPFIPYDLEAAYTTVFSGENLNEPRLKSIMYQLLLAIHYIHSAELVHQDIKPTSILISEDCSIRICSFGNARSLLDPNPFCATKSKNYWSPEAIYMSSDSISSENLKPVDIWAVGCVFAELMLGNALFSTIETSQLLQQIVNLYPELPVFSRAQKLQFPALSRNFNQQNQNFLAQNVFYNFGEEAHDLLLQLLKFDLTERISALNALQHPYFSNLFSKKHLKTFPLPAQLRDNNIPKFLEEMCKGLI